MLKKILVLIIIYIMTLIIPQQLNKITEIIPKTYAEEVLKINSINFDNSDSIIFLGTSAASEQTPLNITKKTLQDPERIFFDIENAQITFPNSTYDIKNSRLSKLKIAQNTVNPSVVRIVIWNSKNYKSEQIKVLRIKNNIIIKLNNDKPVQQYLTQIYKETKGSSAQYYDKAVVIPEQESGQKTESDEIFNKVQKAFNAESEQLVRPNIEQKQARLKSRFFLDKITIKNSTPIISGIGVVNTEKPIYLTAPSRVVFDLPNTIVLQELRDKEFKISETEKIKIGQFSYATARVVITTDTPQAYRPIYSKDLQTLTIAKGYNTGVLSLTEALAELTYFKEQKANPSTEIVNITFNNPVIHSIKRENGKLNLIIYNLQNFNTESFNALALKNNNGFEAKRISTNIFRISFPLAVTDYADCYETLDASQLRFVFTKNSQQITQENLSPKIEAGKTAHPEANDKSNISGNIPFKDLTKNTKVNSGGNTKSKKTEKSAIPAKVKKKTVIIDPGHGGNDTGAMRGNTLEKNITLQIALKVRDILIKKGMTHVIMTRSGDKTLTLQDRVDIANNNNADIYVSIHINASVKREIHGIETHYYSEKGYDVAKIMHKEIMKKVTAADRGLFKSKFYVINHTEAPAVLLELGFISNENEKNALVSEARQKSSAEAIAEGIINYLTEHCNE